MADPAVLAAAPPNELGPDELRVRPGPGGDVAVEPAQAGWRYLSFAVRGVPAAGIAVPGDGRETAIVILAGHDVHVTDGAADWVLDGRTDPFAGLPWAVYLPAHGDLRIGGGTGPVSVAVARAPRSGRKDVAEAPIVIRPDDVAVEVRGAGHATRQINHIIAPGFPADRLLLVEVLTPAGNWSSWPPHKHDEDRMPEEAVLEEVYLYRFRRPAAWGLQRLYRPPGSPAGPPRDASWAVRDGELVLVTDGYHPFSATAADDAYYLNALAGDRRTMACSFDPDLDWVRSTWSDQPTDPRVPLVPRR